MRAVCAQQRSQKKLDPGFIAFSRRAADSSLADARHARTDFYSRSSAGSARIRGRARPAEIRHLSTQPGARRTCSGPLPRRSCVKRRQRESDRGSRSAERPQGKNHLHAQDDQRVKRGMGACERLLKSRGRRRRYHGKTRSCLDGFGSRRDPLVHRSKGGKQAALPRMQALGN